MSPGHDDIRADLEPGATDDLVALAERLRRTRPLPSPAFRGELGRRLAASPRRLGRARVRSLIAVCSMSGTLLLMVGAVGASGHVANL